MSTINSTFVIAVHDEILAQKVSDFLYELSEI